VVHNSPMSKYELIQALRRGSEHVRLLKEELLIHTGKIFSSVTSSRGVVQNGPELAPLGHIGDVPGSIPPKTYIEQSLVAIQMLATRLISETIKLSMVCSAEITSSEYSDLISALKTSCNSLYRCLSEFPQEGGKFHKNLLRSMIIRVFHEVYITLERLKQTIDSSSIVTVSINMDRLETACKKLKEVTKMDYWVCFMKSLDSNQLLLKDIYEDLNCVANHYLEKESGNTTNDMQAHFQFAPEHELRATNIHETHRLNEVHGITTEPDNDFHLGHSEGGLDDYWTYDEDVHQSDPLLDGDPIIGDQSLTISDVPIKIRTRAEAELFREAGSVIFGCYHLHRVIMDQIEERKEKNPLSNAFLLDVIIDHSEECVKHAENLSDALLSRLPIDEVLQYAMDLTEQAEHMINVVMEVCDFGTPMRADWSVLINDPISILTERYGLR
jgi:hypothetical protein